MLSHVQLFVAPQTVVHWAPLFMEFSRHEYWSGLPFPLLGTLPDPGIKPASFVPPALQADSLPWCHLICFGLIFRLPAEIREGWDLFHNDLWIWWLVMSSAIVFIIIIEIAFIIIKYYNFSFYPLDLWGGWNRSLKYLVNILNPLLLQLSIRVKVTFSQGRLLNLFAVRN